MTAIIQLIGYVLLVGGLATLLALYIHRQMRRRRRYLSRLSLIAERLKDFDRRYALVSQHADDYRLSLGPEGVDCITTLGSMIEDMYALVRELDLVIQQGDFETFLLILEFLDGRSDTMLSHWTDEAVQKLIALQHWEHNMEEMLQTIGHTIGEASRINRQAGINKLTPRKRQPTSLSLQEARIYLEQEQEKTNN